MFCSVNIDSISCTGMDKDMRFIGSLNIPLLICVVEFPYNSSRSFLNMFVDIFLKVQQLFYEASIKCITISYPYCNCGKFVHGVLIIGKLWPQLKIQNRYCKFGTIGLTAYDKMI